VRRPAVAGAPVGCLHRRRLPCARPDARVFSLAGVPERRARCGRERGLRALPRPRLAHRPDRPAARHRPDATARSGDEPERPARRCRRHASPARRAGHLDRCRPERRLPPCPRAGRLAGGRGDARRPRAGRLAAGRGRGFGVSGGLGGLGGGRRNGGGHASRRLGPPARRSPGDAARGARGGLRGCPRGRSRGRSGDGSSHPRRRSGAPADVGAQLRGVRLRRGVGPVPPRQPAAQDSRHRGGVATGRRPRACRLRRFLRHHGDDHRSAARRPVGRERRGGGEGVRARYRAIRGAAQGPARLGAATRHLVGGRRRPACPVHGGRRDRRGPGRRARRAGTTDLPPESWQPSPRAGGPPRRSRPGQPVVIGWRTPRLPRARHGPGARRPGERRRDPAVASAGRRHDRRSPAAVVSRGARRGPGAARRRATGRALLPRQHRPVGGGSR
jgi:hypothetical protein